MLTATASDSCLFAAAAPPAIAPESPDLLLTVLLQPGMLLVAYLTGQLARRVMQRWHARLSTSAATLTALISLWAGMAAGEDHARQPHQGTKEHNGCQYPKRIEPDNSPHNTPKSVWMSYWAVGPGSSAMAWS